MGSLISRMKEESKKTGANKQKFLFLRDGSKARIRFLQELDDGMEVVFHDSFTDGVNVPCQEIFGRSCEYCDNEDLRTRSQFLWCVWDVDAKEVKLLMYPVNGNSPVNQLMSFYDTYGTMMDRDYVIKVTGKQTNKAFTVVPMDKAKFNNSKAKPLSENKVLAILDKAWPDENSEDEDDKSKKKRGQKTNTKAKEEDLDEDEDDMELDYNEMSEKELYKLCMEREIESKPRKNKNYYINLLEEYDEAQDDWGDEDEDDDWEDDDE